MLPKTGIRPSGKASVPPMSAPASPPANPEEPIHANAIPQLNGMELTFGAVLSINEITKHDV